MRAASVAQLHRRPRLVVVSHAGVVRLNRGKLGALAMHGFDITLVTPDQWKERDTRHLLVAEGEPSAVFKLKTLPVQQVRPSLTWYTRGTLRRAITEAVPDIVHVEEEPWSLGALQAARICAGLGCPMTLFTWENTQRRLPLPAKVIQRRVFAQIESLVAGSDEAARRARNAGYSGNVSVVPQHGVDVEAFKPRIDRAGREFRGYRPFVIGFIGRLVKQKGPDLLLKAAMKLGDDVTILLVGDGALNSTLRQDAASLGITDRVVFEPGVAHQDVPSHLARMDVLVLPSRTTPGWKEQFGHVLIEAMAAGVPVVGANSGAIPDVIGDAGLLFQEGDADALHARLDSLRDPARRRELAERGRSRVLAEYSNEAIARRLADVFHPIVARS